MNQLNNEELHYKLDENERLNLDRSRQEIRYKVGRDNELSISAIEKDITPNTDHQQPAGGRARSKDSHHKDHIFELIDENIERQRKRTRDIISGKRPTNTSKYDANTSFDNNRNRKVAGPGLAAGQYRSILRDGLQVKNIFKNQGTVNEVDEVANRRKLKRSVDKGITRSELVNEKTPPKSQAYQQRGTPTKQYLSMIHDRVPSANRQMDNIGFAGRPNRYIDDHQDQKRLKKPSPDYDIFQRGTGQHNTKNVVSGVAAGARTVRDSHNDPQNIRIDERPKNPYLYQKETVPEEVYEYSSRKPMISFLEERLSKLPSSNPISSPPAPSPSPIPDPKKTATFTTPAPGPSHPPSPAPVLSPVPVSVNRPPVSQPRALPSLLSMRHAINIDRRFVKPNESVPQIAGLYGRGPLRESIPVAPVDVQVVESMVEKGVTKAKGLDKVHGVVELVGSLKESLKQKGYLEDERVTSQVADKIIENAGLLDYLSLIYDTDSRVIDAAFALKRRLLSAQNNKVGY